MTDPLDTTTGDPDPRKADTVKMPHYRLPASGSAIDDLASTTGSLRVVPSAAGHPLPTLDPPERLGRYTLTHRLGKGGMAEVFVALQDGPAGFEKTCVIKRIRRSLVEEQRFVDMFLREARVAARLNHANIVQIFELGQEGDEYFIAMEFLDGISLHRAARRCWANEEPVPMEVVLRCMADAALGLHHAHTLRARDGQVTPLIHRDISPDNLMLTRDGLTKVLDFGIAKTEGVDEVTKTGELKGKIPYMSPEQIRGDDLDGRSDLWSLGVTFYWLLTGRRPFDAKTDHMTIDRVLRHTPVPPRELNPLIPPLVQKLVLSLLEKDADARVPSGQVMHDVLVELLGPAASTGPASSFANRAMTMPANEASLTPGSVITVVAARPETRWLKRLGTDPDSLVNHVPPPTQSSASREAVVSRVQMGAGIDTAETASEVHSASEIRSLDQALRPRRLGAAMLGLVAALSLFGVAWVLTAPSAEVNATDAPPRVYQQPAHAGGLASTPPPDPAPPPEVTSSPAAGEATRSNPEKNAPARAATATPRSPKAKPKRGTVVATKAPASVLWKLRPSRPTLGRGSTRLRVPPKTEKLVAIDMTSGGRTHVPIEGGVADYTQRKRGSLRMLVRPWAKVQLGKRVLGTTPLDPVSLVEGLYKVKLSWQDKVRYESVVVHAGKQAVIKVDMRK